MSLTVLLLASLAAAAQAGVVAGPALSYAPAAIATQEYDAHPEYHFEYAVSDDHTGDHKSQQESRSGDVVQGSYSLIEPDGTRRVVQYAADPVNGFNAVVNREPAAAPAVVAAPAPIAYAPRLSYASPAVSYAPRLSYAAPAVSYAAPAVSYAAPAVSYAPRLAAPAYSYAAPALSYAPRYSAIAAPAIAAPAIAAPTLAHSSFSAPFVSYAY